MKPALLCLPYAVLAVLILGPLLAPGFVLTMDLVFAPHIPWPGFVDNTFALYAALHVVNSVIPADVLEKSLLAAALLLSSIGMHRLMSYLLARPVLGISYAAGVFYMINPFVYTRLISGQFAVLLGYALLPWCVQSLLGLLRRPDWRQMVRVSAWVVAISIVSIHVFGMLVIVLGTLLAIRVWQNRRNRGYLKKAAQLVLASGIVVCIVSSYWLVPALSGKGTIAASVKGFDATERSAYATVDTNGNSRVLAVLGLQGFWADTSGLYVLPVDAVNAWRLWQLTLWVLLIYGAVVSLRRQKAIAVYLGSLGCVAVVLALGFLNDWLAQWLPFFAGFREPQKFVVLLAFADSYFLGMAMFGLLEQCRRWRWLRTVPVVMVCLLIGLYTPTMFWGLYDQLTPRQYPADWYATNDLLDADPASGEVLFLPWHLYMNFRFAGRIIASPAQKFFDRPTIVSNDPEFANAKPQLYDATKARIGQLLALAARGTAIADPLRNLHVRYILLAKEVDWFSYGYLNRQPGIRLISETADMKVYKIEY